MSEKKENEKTKMEKNIKTLLILSNFLFGIFLIIQILSLFKFASINIINMSSTFFNTIFMGCTLLYMIFSFNYNKETRKEMIDREDKRREEKKEKREFEIIHNKTNSLINTLLDITYHFYNNFYNNNSITKEFYLNHLKLYKQNPRDKNYYILPFDNFIYKSAVYPIVWTANCLC